MISDVEHVPVGHLFIFFGKVSVWVLYLFEKVGLSWCFVIELYDILVYLGYSCPIGYVVYKYFLPFHRSSFHFVDVFFCCTEAFELGVVSCVFAFVAFAFGIKFPKSLSRPMSRSFFLCFLLGIILSVLTFKSLIHFEIIFLIFKFFIEI